MEHNEKKKVIPAINERYYFIPAFFAGCLFMYLFLSFSGLLTSGKYCMLSSDSLEIYVPNIREMCRNILNGENIYYSWSHSMGMNMSLSLAFYGAFNPFNLLYLIFFHADPNIITAVIVILKTGLAAMTFQLFSSRGLKITNFSSVFFALFYSMCSFQVSFDVVNFIWMDALYMFPLVFLSLYYLAEKGDFKPLCLCYAYLFITQFYMGYVTGIISTIFFIGSIWLLEKKVKVYKFILGFLAAGLISVMISASVWAPALYYLINHSTSDATDFLKSQLNLLDVYNQLFFSNNSGAYGIFPNIYCGIPALILVPAYFLYAKNKKKEKILYGVVLLFIALAFVVPPIYVFLHAFDAPDGWCNRFSWAFSFLFCTVALMGFREIERIGIKFLIVLISVNMLIYSGEIFWIKHRFASGERVNTPIYLLVNLGLIAVWGGFLLYLKKNNSKNIQTIAIACLLLAGIECAANGYTSYLKNGDFHARLEEFLYYGYLEEQRSFLKTMEEDKSFYRADYPGSIVINSDTDGGYKGISDFETVENENVRTALRHLGIATSPRVVYADGFTPVTDMLLSVKYRMKANEKNIFYQIMPEKKPPLRIEKLREPLALGFMVCESVKEVEFYDNVFENNNRLLAEMIGEESTQVFECLDSKDLDAVSDGIFVEKREDGSFAFFSEREGTNKVDLVMEPNGISETNPVYIYFDNTESVSVSGSMIISGDTENLSSNGGIISVSYIKQFEKENDRLKVSIYSYGINKQRVKAVYTAVLLEPELKKVYEKLAGNQLDVWEYSNTYIKGFVHASEDKTLLFTTIPYDKDWEIMVNGQRIEGIPLLDGAFTGIELPGEGDYTLEMRYHFGWLKEGLLLSVIGILTLAFFSVYGNIKYKSGKNTDVVEYS